MWTNNKGLVYHILNVLSQTSCRTSHRAHSPTEPLEASTCPRVTIPGEPYHYPFTINTHLHWQEKVTDYLLLSNNFHSGSCPDLGIGVYPGAPSRDSPLLFSDLQDAFALRSPSRQDNLKVVVLVFTGPKVSRDLRKTV